MVKKYMKDFEEEMQERRKKELQEEKERRERKASVIPKTDLRKICRASSHCLTVVTIEVDWETKAEWLRLGQTHIRSQRDRPDGRWRLDAHLANNACDAEHDTAYACRLPLIGVQFQGVDYHQLTLVAWVDPNCDSHEGFHVPRPDYDPTKLPKTEICSGKYDGKKNFCKWNEGKPHPIVPSGFYVPPFDQELYEIVRGKRVEILIGPAKNPE